MQYILDSFSSSRVAEVMITLREGRCAEAALTKPNRISVLKDLMVMINGNRRYQVN